MVRIRRIGLRSAAWEAAILPLNYIRKFSNGIAVRSHPTTERYPHEKLNFKNQKTTRDLARNFGLASRHHSHFFYHSRQLP